MIMSCYIIVINVIVLVLMGIDKRRAIKDKQRISERVLLTLTIIGGFIGLGLGIALFNHKTNHLKFYLVMGLSIIIWLVGIYFFLRVVN